VSVSPGTFVCVVGPSGVGKDTLLRLAKEKLASTPGFAFPRRLVTRPQSEYEDHAVLSEQAFVDGIRDGLFALWWRAHGLGYALDRDVLSLLADGDVVACNVSREVIAVARETFAHLTIVLVAATATAIAARLAARGREMPADIGARLTRNAEFSPGFAADFIVDNSGPPAVAAEKLVNILKAIAAAPR
jgi:ribose 1,5-bisphosphokinase